ncbi:Pectinesterase inhibitor domain [Dillenia turbinata]|uniref:Pectinesterase inhibitor domain n=1 Tax=Dillenia turbinata TaxID=194707 RepID=A0AAN8W0B7_9MAGN
MSSRPSMSPKFFILFHVVFSVIVASQGDPVEDICNKTPYPNLCTSIAKEAGVKEADAKKIGLAVFEKDNAKAIETLNFIKQLLNQKPDPSILKPLQDCSGSYEAVVTEMGPIRDGLALGNPKFAEQYANSCATEANNCEGYFPPSKSPLTDKNKDVHDLSAVIATLAHLLL